MQNTMLKSLYLAATLLVCCGTGAFASDSLTLLSPPNSGYTEGGVYTSPYNISVNGTPMQLICDDFTTDITVGETWPASPTTLTVINASSVAGLKFANASYNGSILGGATNVVQDYAIAAVLAAELLLLPNSDTAEAAAYSYAIWDVFDSTLLGTSYQTMSDPYGTLTQLQWDAAIADLQSAISLVGTVPAGGGVDLNNISINGTSIASVTIYTPVPQSGAQEFLGVSMPEPSYPAVLAVDLLAVVGLIVVLRRRLTGIFN